MSTHAHPETVADAIGKVRAASERQRAAIERARAAGDQRARDDYAYTVALSKRCAELEADGMAATARRDFAKGMEDIAELRLTRNLSAEVARACEHEVFRASADRRTSEVLLDWAIKADLRTRDHAPTAAEPAWDAGRAA